MNIPEVGVKAVRAAIAKAGRIRKRAQTTDVEADAVNHMMELARILKAKGLDR